MRSRLPILIAMFFCFVALPAGATTSAPLTPVVTGVSPLNVGVGQTLTITGSGFVPGKLKNTVVFQRSRSRAVFVRADNATSRKLTLVVPSKLLPFLARRGGTVVGTRFQLRVLARRFGPKFTPLTMSPVIGPVPAGVAPGPKPSTYELCVKALETGSPAADSDSDVLTDGVEKKIKTDPCNPDSDKDGVEDGFEYESALDLNSRALPYPGKRPFPNALDGGDAGKDFDGDGLTMQEEYSLWVRVGGHKLPLDYSDGNQNSGGSAPVPAGQGYMDQDSSGTLSDDEKDADGDGLPNWDELRGAFAGGNVKNMDYSPTLDYLDADTDGDGLADGQDDQDHDGLSNLAEAATPVGCDSEASCKAANIPAYKVASRVKLISSNPLDPCAPANSRVCPIHRQG